MYNKHLTLVPIGGLANRFYAVTSALSFCLDNQIALKVIWFKDKGMGAGFYDLFNLDPSLRQDVTVVDAKWSVSFVRIQSIWFILILFILIRG